jgi:hypothetical protein
LCCNRELRACTASVLSLSPDAEVNNLYRAALYYQPVTYSDAVAVLQNSDTGDLIATILTTTLPLVVLVYFKSMLTEAASAPILHACSASFLFFLFFDES